jgi:hypothetical protein
MGHLKTFLPSQEPLDQKSLELQESDIEYNKFCLNYGPRVWEEPQILHGRQWEKSLRTMFSKTSEPEMLKFI